ncbi:hypothetical protein [Candidatus Enterococcus courvalinii]|uniref:Adhesin domain-containing protein n=1 Tax=Candidatus Enterococcus courvalinii TaxID=2815329 RepID=A0ABS3HXY5_9ENTE|nr:hypothetical protein [Enterococcus sp. MSG2901]MBO0481270.1 hypothetical protein [Enterococcus sp. MSG2901]
MLWGITGGYSLHVTSKNYTADKIKYFKTNEELIFDTENFRSKKEITVPRNIDTKEVYADISSGEATLLVDGQEYSLEDGQNGIVINEGVRKLQIEGEFSGSIQISSS